MTSLPHTTQEICRIKRVTDYMLKPLRRKITQKAWLLSTKIPRFLLTGLKWAGGVATNEHLQFHQMPDTEHELLAHCTLHLLKKDLDEERDK